MVDIGCCGIKDTRLNGDAELYMAEAVTRESRSPREADVIWRVGDVMGIPERQFDLVGFRVVCLACNAAWWDTETLEKDIAIKKAIYDHSVENDHSGSITAFSFI